MLEIGKIVGFHGLKGDVKIPYSERLFKNLSQLKQVYVFPLKKKVEVLEIEHFKVHGSNILLKFAQYSDKTEVEHLKGAILKQEKDLLAPLDNEEYFIGDLIGLDVFDADNNKIGKVKSVLSKSFSNDIIEVKTLNERVTMIPFVEELVPEVDVKNKRLIINNIPGLIDDEI